MAKNSAPDTRTSVDELNGDLGHGHKPWSPGEGQQGISNRPDDETDATPDGPDGPDAPDGPDGDEASDADAFNPSNEGDD